jgi:hypothetical protein
VHTAAETMREKKRRRLPAFDEDLDEDELDEEEHAP